MENIFDLLGGRKATFFLAVVVLLIAIAIMRKYGFDLPEGIEKYLLFALGIYSGANAVSDITIKK